MTTSAKTVWKIDPTHSEVQFKVKHLVMSTVNGRFGSFDGQIETDDDPFENAEATFTAEIDSITTNDNDRNQFLKSVDFFNAEKFPQLKFVSTNFEKIGDGEYNVTGNMTIRNVTKEVTLRATHGGTVSDPYGQTKAGFTVACSINRNEFGLTWSAVTEAGNLIVSNEVTLQLNVQLVQQ